MKDKDIPISFRLKEENKKRLSEIEEYIPTVSNRNAAMNFIIQSYYEVVITPRKNKIEEIKKDMKAFGISINDLT
ncbi:MAG TPA: hypothetical protein VMV86_05075 [Methanosarcinales archaeon]|nr:hypothetical protein [Methanosarcinales archaeon]